MNEILSLEQISDIDTFTLQEKIQQLEKHPLAKLYEQVIAIAKVQLNERYKVQEFGRMLINDEIPIFPQIKLTNLQQIPTQKPQNKSQRKIDFSQCLKKSLITKDEDFMIGKSAVGNYRHTSRQAASSSTNVSNKSKKSSLCLDKKVSNIYNKAIQTKLQIKNKNTIFHPPIPLPSVKTIKKQAIARDTKSFSTTIQNDKSKNSKVAKQINKNIQIIKKNQMIKEQQQIKQLDLPLKLVDNKLNHQKKSMIKYIENDVYDGEKLILDAPQKLTQINLQCENENQKIQQQIKTQQVQKDQQPLLNNSKMSQSIKQEQSLYQKHKREVQIAQLKAKQQQITKLNEIRLSTISQNKINNKSYIQQVIQKTEQILQISTQNCTKVEKTENSDVQSTNVANLFSSPQQNKQLQSPSTNIQKQNNNNLYKVKSISCSAKNLSKVSQTLQIVPMKNMQAKTNTEQNIVILPIQLKQNNQKQKIKNKTTTNFIKQTKINSCAQRISTNMGKLQIQRKIQLKVFNYHQIIPTFNKLFPHSPNLSTDLRQIQKQLQDHINRNINSLSLNDQYLRIRQQQLLFKAVSQSQKAIKYHTIFDINLDSFKERSRIMIDRIKKQIEAPQQQKLLLYRVVRQKQDVYDIINNAFHRTQQWYELPHGMDLKTSWNLLWTWSKPQINLKQLFYFQKVNHFFGNKEIARKDLLKKNIQRIKKLGSKAKASFDIIPQTYYLPGQNMQFVRKFNQYQTKEKLNYWIMKPVGLSRGRGIQVVKKLQDIVFSQPVVLQKYLSNPLLLDGYKFDMRIYVLVNSINPLQAYVYKQGFARISTQKYSLDSEDITNKFIHLTNFSVQKQNLQGQSMSATPNFALNAFEKQIGGCKITLKMLKQKLSQQNIKWQSIQSQIDSIVLKSLISTMNVIEQNPNCFELFGYDIIIDENLKCWLIQVNSSPSLQKDFTIDQVIKQQLVDDIIEIVNPIPYDRVRLLEVVSRRRKQLQGLKSHINTQNNSTTQLNQDLDYILHGRALHKYGQAKSNPNFRRVAPGQTYYSIIKTVQQYKLTSITKQQSSKNT